MKEKKKKIEEMNFDERMKYLSWTKLLTWETDKNRFYQIYWENLKLNTPATALGKRTHDCLENGYDEERNQMIEEAANNCPPCPNREHEIEVIYDGIPLYARLDGFDEENLIIHEVKTGKRYRQQTADKLGQITFYSFLVYIKYGKMPHSSQLHWARTIEDLEGKLTLSGEIKTFITKRQLRDVILMSKRVKRAWHGIQAFVEFINKNKKEKQIYE